MSIYVSRKKGESSEKSVNRFKKLTQRLVRNLKQSMFRPGAERKRDTRQKALMREKHRANRAKTEF